MTRNIYDGSFKESENFVIDDYIQKALLESEPKVVQKRFIGIIVVLTFIIIGYYFSIYLEIVYPETGKTIPVRFGNLWNIMCVLIFVFYCTKMFHLKQIVVISSYYYNFTMLIIVSLFGVQLFLFLLSLAKIVSNSYIPMIVYPPILLIFIFNRNMSVNKSIIKALYEDDLYENKFLKRYGKFDKCAKKYGGLIVTLLFVFEKIFGTNASTNDEITFTRRVATAFSPLLIIIGFFVIIAMKEEVVQGFYLKKYCEEYRLKYGFSKEEWYGSKSKQFKEEKKGKGF